MATEVQPTVVLHIASNKTAVAEGPSNIEATFSRDTRQLPAICVGRELNILRRVVTSESNNASTDGIVGHVVVDNTVVEIELAFQIGNCGIAVSVVEVVTTAAIEEKVTGLERVGWVASGEGGSAELLVDFDAALIDVATVHSIGNVLFCWDGRALSDDCQCQRLEKSSEKHDD
jgi:hypothetical protein